MTEYVTTRPAFGSRVESGVGQFTSDNIQITVNNLRWWASNIFNAASNEYLEMKVVLTLAVTSTWRTADDAVVFSGFIDKVEPSPNEVADTVTISVRTADDMAGRIAAEKVNTQYLNPNVDGAFTQGLVLPTIPGLFVTDAAVSSYNLKVGQHTITYEYNAGAPQIKLDDGDWSLLPGSDGSITIANNAGDQKITLYCTPAVLPISSGTFTEYVIVITAGTTLPRQPWYGLTIKQMMMKLYAEIGLTNISFDTLACNTEDGTANVSFLDVPPMDASVGGNRYAIASDGTDLWMAVDKYIYKRTMATDAYTLHATLSNGDVVKKLMYNARNNELFIYYTNGSNAYIRRYRIGSVTLSAATTISTVSNAVNAYGMVLLDYNYAGANWEYAVVFSVDGSGLKRMDCSSMAVTQPAAFVDTGITYAEGATFVFTKSSTALTSTKLWYARKSVADSWLEYKEVEITTTSAWANNGRKLTGIPEFIVAAFEPVGGRIFHVTNSTGTPAAVEYHTTASATATTLVSFAENETAENVYASSGKIIFTVKTNTALAGTFYCYNGTTLEKMVKDVTYNAFCSVVYSVDRFYGIGVDGVLWQYHTVIVFSALRVNGEQKTVRAVMADILNSYILVGKISSAKTVRIHRRADDSGNIITSGNNMALNVSNVEDITRVDRALAKFDLISVSNGTTTVTYDGTTFGAYVLSDARRLEIPAVYAPSHILRAIAKYAWAYFSVDHDKYKFPVLAAMVQYEPMDGAAVTFTTTKIQKTATGLIVEQTIKDDASMEIRVMI